MKLLLVTLTTAISLLAPARAETEAESIAALQGLGLGTLGFTKDAQGRVTGVKIDGATPLLDVHLEHFASFPELRSLLISHAVKLSGKGATSLSKLTRLEEFQAGGTRWSDDGLAQLSALPHLQSLQLRHSNVSDAGMAHIAKMPALKKILVNPHGKPTLTDAGLKLLGQVATLEEVTLEDITLSYDGCFAHWKSLKNLKQINTRGAAIAAADLDKLKADHHDLTIKDLPAPKKQAK